MTSPMALIFDRYLPTPPHNAYSERLDLEDPIENYQSVEQVIDRLAQALLLGLKSRQAGQLTFILEMENGQTLEQAVQPPDPISSYKAMVERATALLYRQPIASGIVSVEMQLTRYSPASTQTTIFI